MHTAALQQVLVRIDETFLQSRNTLLRFWPETEEIIPDDKPDGMDAAAFLHDAATKARVMRDVRFQRGEFIPDSVDEALRQLCFLATSAPAVSAMVNAQQVDPAMGLLIGYELGVRNVFHAASAAGLFENAAYREVVSDRRAESTAANNRKRAWWHVEAKAFWHRRRAEEPSLDPCWIDHATIKYLKEIAGDRHVPSRRTLKTLRLAWVAHPVLDEPTSH